MFDKKEKIKFYAELLRNLGTALVAGAYMLTMTIIAGLIAAISLCVGIYTKKV